MRRIPCLALVACACLSAGLAFSLVGRAAAPAAPAQPSAPAEASPLVRDPRLPSRVPVSWELNIRHGELERVIVPVDGVDRSFWYMRYTVINKSGRDVLFTPSFEIVAETGTSTVAFKNVPTTVYEKIKGLYNNPLLKSPTDIYGKLLQGEDNARDGVAIFPALDPEARNFQVFIMGLSGETSEVTNPKTNKPVILQKTLELDFNIPGEAIGIAPLPRLTATKWVMK